MEDLSLCGQLCVVFMFISQTEQELRLCRLFSSLIFINILKALTSILVTVHNTGQCYLASGFISNCVFLSVSQIAVTT